MIRPRGQRLSLTGAETGKRFDDENAWQRSAPGREDVGEKLSVVGALFHEGEIVGVSELFPHFDELRGEKFAEDRTDADAGEKVAAASGLRPV
jgi:hypothetical protein